MEAGRASRTSLMVAAYRARASARPGAICRDPWAARLAGDEGQEYARRHDAVWEPAETWLALRTAAIDREVRRFLAPPHSFRQVVLLGAGLDTRAERIGGEGVTWFEIDHPATQADKRRRLAALGDYPVDAARFVPVDFEHERFLEKLVAAGFSAEAPALFLWEGVVLYLPEPAVRATMRAVAQGCEPRSVLLFDYVGKAMAQGSVDERDQRVRELLADLVEPVRFGSDDIVPVLYEEGFRRVHTRNFDELCLDFTGTYERERKFRFQRLALASRETLV